MPARTTRVAAVFLLMALAYPIACRAGAYEDGDSDFQRKNYRGAMQHWYAIAAAGHAQAQLGVATLYYGGLGVAIDYDQAFDWYAKAADQAVPQAQYMLGAMYRDGKGVQQDQAKAVVLFRKAADQDIQGAHYSLGLMYLNGTGLVVDNVEACFWLSLAAEATGKSNAQLRATAAYLRDQASAKLSQEQLAAVKQRVGDRKSGAR